MALYSLHTSAISRKAGRSAVAAAAYRAGVAMLEERAGREHDYTRKVGVEHVELFALEGITLNSASELWNAAEAAEKRKDGRTAREVLVALPAELDADQRLALAREMTADLVERYGVAAQLAVHAPDRDGDQRNHHAHILITTRRYNHDGLGEKSQLEWSGTQCRENGVAKPADEIVALRKRWADIQNAGLERAGVSARVDHRSLADQKIYRVPQVHVGNYGTQMIRQGTPERSERSMLNQQIIETNHEVQHLREQLDVEQAVQEWAEITPATQPSPAPDLPDPAPSPAADAEMAMARESARRDVQERVEAHIASRHQLQIRAELRALERAEEREWEKWISRPEVCSASGRIYTESWVDSVIERERALPENQPPKPPQGRMVPWPPAHDPVLDELRRAAARQREAVQEAVDVDLVDVPPDLLEPVEIDIDESAVAEWYAAPAFDARQRALEIVMLSTPEERHAALLSASSGDLLEFDELTLELENLMDSAGELLPAGQRLRDDVLPLETPTTQRAERAPGEQDWEPPGSPGGPGL